MGAMEALENVTPEQAGEVMETLRGILEALPADHDSETDLHLRSHLHMLITGYRVGAGTTDSQQVYT